MEFFKRTFQELIKTVRNQLATLIHMEKTKPWIDNTFSERLKLSIKINLSQYNHICFEYSIIF